MTGPVQPRPRGCTGSESILLFSSLVLFRLLQDRLSLARWPEEVYAQDQKAVDKGKLEQVLDLPSHAVHEIDRDIDLPLPLKRALQVQVDDGDRAQHALNISLLHIRILSRVQLIFLENSAISSPGQMAERAELWRGGFYPIDHK